MTLINSGRAICSFALVLTSIWVVRVVAQTQTPVAKTPGVAVVEDKLPPSEDETKPTGETSVAKAESVLEVSEKPGKESTLTKSTVKPKPQGSTNDGWQFQVTPYLWIAGISGRAGVGGLEVDVSSGITDSDVHLNFGFMGTFEARKNKLVLLTDLQYSNLGTENPTPGPLFTTATADFKTFILDPEVGYRVAENPDTGNFVDVMGGIRYWHLRSDLTFSGGFLLPRFFSASRDWVDAVGGVRTRIHLSPKWFLSGKADLGGGGSKFTFQLFGAVGWKITNSIALIGGYRYISVDYDKDNFLFDMNLSGPVVGVGFRF